MKKVLLGSTALIGAALLAAPAQAQLEVTVGGSVGFQAGWFDNDVTNNNDRDFQSEADLIVRASGVADNGLEYGAEVVLQSSTSDSSNADESFLYVGGTWGRLIFGDEDGASELGVTAPTVGIGQINGSLDDFDGGAYSSATGYAANDRGDATFKALDTDDDTKVTYYTPVFSGFQAGVSYVPESGSAGATGETVALTNPTTGASDVIETALRYTGEFSGVGVTAAGQYNFGEANAAGAEDLRAWDLGLQLAYQGFKVGGGYTDNGDSLAAANADNSNWNVGGTYENGPWGVGISYIDAEDDVTGDFSEVALGATYTVAPGLTTGVDVGFFDSDAAAGDGTVVIGEVKAAF